MNPPIRKFHLVFMSAFRILKNLDVEGWENVRQEIKEWFKRGGATVIVERYVGLNNQMKWLVTAKADGTHEDSEFFTNTKYKL